MAEHYRRGDPERGCGLIVLVLIVILILVLAVGAWLMLGAPW